MSFARVGMTASRTVLRTSSAAVASTKRNMSAGGTPEEVFQSKEMWFKTTVGALFGIIIPYTAFTWYKELHHEHHEKAAYPHMHIRHKAFPWKENDCDMLDMHCKQEWRAAHAK